MSDDGVMNVEDDGPAVPVVEAPAAPVEAAPVEVPADPNAEPATVEVDGQVMVPLGALKAERQQRQTAEKELARVKPYAEFIEKNPNLVRPQAPQAPTTFGAPPPDPRLEGLAKSLDLYTTEGKPDLARASYLHGFMMQTAQQISQQQMAPLREENDQTKSARNFQVALATKDGSGRSPSMESLAAVWQTMPAWQTADPQVASVLTLTALGLDMVTKRGGPAPVAAPGNAPIVTEGVTGAPRKASLSQLETNLARERGITDAKWAENTKTFQPGRSNQLED